MNIPEAEPVYSTVYTNFKGVDFTSTIPDRSRFPIGKNFVVADDVHKRNGYELVHQYEGRINGFYDFKLADKQYNLVHAGDKMYLADRNFIKVSDTPFLSDVPDEKSSGFSTGDAFYVLTGDGIVKNSLRKINDNERVVSYTIPSNLHGWSYTVSLEQLATEQNKTFDGNASEVLSVTNEYLFTDGSGCGFGTSNDGEKSFVHFFGYDGLFRERIKGREVTAVFIPGRVTLSIDDKGYCDITGYEEEIKREGGICVDIKLNAEDYSYDEEGKNLTVYSSEFAGADLHINTPNGFLYTLVSEEDVDLSKFYSISLNELSTDFKTVSSNLPKNAETNIPIDGAYYSSDKVYIPVSNAGIVIDIPYISSDEISATELSADNRYYFSMRLINGEFPDSKESVRGYASEMDIPVIKSGLKFFASNSVASNTWTYDLLMQDYSGESTGEEFNLLTPFVIYQGDAFKFCRNNSTERYVDGYIIPELEGAGSQHAWFLFEDGNVFEAYVRRLTNNDIANSLSDDKDNLRFSVVTTRTDDIIPTTYKNKPFKILFITESSYKLFNDNAIWKSKVHGVMQYGNGIYHFFTGNEKHPNRDWHSAINNPMSFPSSGYTIYGEGDNILGYSSYGQYLVVFKDSKLDSNIYIRRAEYNSELGVTFPSSVGVGGAASGLSAETIKNLNGETLYLSSDGIYALTSLSTSDFQVTRKRSFYIDGRLKEEPNLTEATACVWNNRYLLGVNGTVYILDGTQPKDYIEGTNNEYSYECLYWDNIPARVFFPFGEELYFGTDNGEVFKFNEGYEDNGEPIELVIATRLDDDGDFMSLKRVKKKGTGMMVNPFSRSSFEVAYRYDDYLEQPVKTVYADIFDFSDIDFSRISFNPSDAPRVIPFMKKSKKYKLLQIIMRSLNKEPFSLMGIIKRFTINNFVKK